MRGAGILILTACALAWTVDAKASNAKASVVIALEQAEHELNTRRWTLNTRAEKKDLAKKVALLKRLYDRIVKYESDIAAFPCAGASVDPEGGPPQSSEGSDIVGNLNQGFRAQQTVSGVQPVEGNAPLPSGPGRRVFFMRSITDVEVKLLTRIVKLEHQMTSTRWNLSTLTTKNKLEAERQNLLRVLRRVRNSHC